MTRGRPVLDDHPRRQRLWAAGDALRRSGVRFPAPERALRLADQLYAQLLDQIVRGSLTAGQRLPSENQLSSDFGVSRPVIREALSRLQADGLVTTRHGSGTFVVGRQKDRSIKLPPIAGIPALVLCFEFRTALECETAGLAARRWARPHIKAIEAALTEFDRDDERDLCNVTDDHRFHLAVARASQNVLLEEAVTVLLGHISAGIDLEPKTSGGLSRQTRLLVRREHHAITAAIRGRDEEQACAAMRHHLEHARMRILDESMRL